MIFSPHKYTKRYKDTAVIIVSAKIYNLIEIFKQIMIKSARQRQQEGQFRCPYDDAC